MTDMLEGGLRLLFKLDVCRVSERSNLKRKKPVENLGGEAKRSASCEDDDGCQKTS